MISPAPRRLRPLRWPALFALGLLLNALAVAADAPEQAFDLPADTAANSIKRFSEQTNLEVLYASAVTSGVRTAAVKGEMTPRKALDAMLAGTGLIVVQDEQTNAFSVRRESAGPKVPRAPLPEGSDRPMQKIGKTGDQAITLDPFEVKTSKDTSYGALNSNSITRFSTELDKTPISADIFTEDFMRDVDATSIQGMLSQYGAGMGTVLATPSTDSNLTQPGDRPLFGDRFTPPQMGVRGLSAGNLRRDGFTNNPTNTGNTDNFDIERVEVLRGPQGLLYGAGGAGGTIEITSKQAHFDQTAASVSERVDQYGSKRTMLDVNEGSDWFAARFGLLREDTQQRRLFIGDLTEGYYGQLAFRLPLNTTLRVEAEYTYDKRLDPAAISVNFGSAANDPRNGDSLGYLLATNQAGADNPATGLPFSKFGAVDNGLLNWFNKDSFAGWRQEDDTKNLTYEVAADTVWASWLATTVGINYNRSIERLYNGGISSLTAPLQGGNPFNSWAVNSLMQDTVNDSLHKAARASALITKDFFSGFAKTQTAIGWDYEWRGSGPDDYAYYLSDANGNIVTSPSVLTNLGRTPMGVQWWDVGGGPQLHPVTGVPLETPTFFSAQDGKYYTRAEQNPRSASYVTATNPFGTASLNPAISSGVGGINAGGYDFLRYVVNGYYGSNYTSWWGDRFSTLVGYRLTDTQVPISSGGSLNGPSLHNASYNLGADGKITDWLRWYYSFSSTYNDSIGFTDPDGNPPPTSSAKGWEAGLKFTPFGGRVSGSLAYYDTNAHDQNTNYGSSIINSINPAGLNGTYKGPAGRNGWIPLDQTSSGVELILTAAPTHNWRIRLAATQEDGKIGTTAKYGLIYNDQFFTDGKGGVTYGDGSPFLVPVNGALVSGIKANVDPATILTPGVASQQLTTAMIGDPTSVYFQAGQGNPANANGQISSGLGGSPTSDVGNALRFFNKPNVGTALTGALGLPISDLQYAWPDPNHTGGSFTIANAGESTVGYPVYRVSLTNTYEFSTGWIKGFGTILSLNDAWQFRTYYYNNPDGSRALYSQPELGWQIDLSPYYRRKVFGRYEWRTQLNIANLTNHYTISLTPNNGSGFTVPTGIGVRWNGVPRAYSWTNTISF